jgi:hypothetical protein
MDTITLTHHGRTVALAARARFWLAAEIEALPDNDPRKRHVCFMAIYARDILSGEMPGPYTDTDADHFARLVTSSDHGRAATGRRCRLAPDRASALPGRRARSRRCG